MSTCDRLVLLEEWTGLKSRRWKRNDPSVAGEMWGHLPLEPVQLGMTYSPSLTASRLPYTVSTHTKTHASVIVLKKACKRRASVIGGSALGWSHLDRGHTYTSDTSDYFACISDACNMRLNRENVYMYTEYLT